MTTFSTWNACCELNLQYNLFAFNFYRWNDFKSQLQDMLRHSDTKGVELKKPSSSLYTFPVPDCMCKHADVNNASGNRGRLLWYFRIPNSCTKDYILVNGILNSYTKGFVLVTFLCLSVIQFFVLSFIWYFKSPWIGLLFKPKFSISILNRCCNNYMGFLG